MRSDFGRIVIERERSGSSNKSCKVRYFGKIVDGEYYGPTKLPMSKRRQAQYNQEWDYKQSTDVLRPIKGYLLKNLGRPWDDVWSEMCGTLRSGGVGVSHILQAHIDVYHKCWWGELTMGPKKGTVGLYGARIGSRIGCWSVDNGDFYVDPETGLLQKWGEHKRSNWRQWQGLSLERMYARDGLWYVLIDGLWYLGTYSKGAYKKRTYSNHTNPRKLFGDVYEYQWPDFNGWKFNVVKSASKKDLKDIRRKLYLRS